MTAMCMIPSQSTAYFGTTAMPVQLVLQFVNGGLANDYADVYR